ncbi:MAG: class IV aminotransferase [Acidobacteria bacterium]|nr:MAG: class IV aminotransferase [Acidobacteriota bacterium]
MDPLILHNDCILPLQEARLSPGQVGLLMGWGVFMTLRIYRAQPFAFERHWARMGRDAARLGVTFDHDQKRVREAIVELARANQRPEGMARVSFVKNKGGLWEQAEGHPATDLLVFTRELVSWPPGYRLRLQPMAIFSAGRHAGAKMLSWVSYASALGRAHADGFHEVLFLNEKGQLAECSSANIFLVRGARALTPPLASGCLPGVTREILLEIAPQAGVELVEQDLAPDDLSSAEEVFISSTTREVAGVESISPNWNYKPPGPITQTLDRAFREYVKSEIGN